MAVVDERHKVLEGRDGFLFLTQDTNNLLEQHAGRRRFSAAELAAWRALLERRIERVSATGGRYVFAVAPNTHSVYPEHLPAGIVSAPRRPVHELIHHLQRTHSPARVLYPDKAMAARKADRQLFMRTDTHWTDYGAFLVYRFLTDAITGDVAMRVLDEDDLFYMEQTITGDLGGKLDPPRDERARVARVAQHVSHPVYDNCIEGTGSVVVTRCEAAPPTTCVLLGDSYSYALLKFLPETFGRFMFVQRPSLPAGLLELERPDVVISVMAERFLARVPSDADGPAQREVEERKRATGRVRSPQALYGIRPDFAAPAQVEAIRAWMVARGSLRDATVVSLMAYASLGPQDVMALRWSDVREGHIHVTPRQVAASRRVPLWDVVADDLARWRDATGSTDDKLVFTDPEAAWSIREWGAWRDECYAPAVAPLGLGRLRPWGLHNTYVHLRLVEGATPAQVAAETGVETNDYAIARARTGSDEGRAPLSGDVQIRAARRAQQASGGASDVS